MQTGKTQPDTVDRVHDVHHYKGTQCSAKLYTHSSQS